MTAEPPLSAPADERKGTNMFRDRKKLIAAIVVGALVLTWVGAIGASLLLDLSKGQKLAMALGLAVATEVALWVGGVLLGITALARIRGWMRLRWSGKERQRADSAPKAR